VEGARPLAIALLGKGALLQGGSTMSLCGTEVWLVLWTARCEGAAMLAALTGIAAQQVVVEQAVPLSTATRKANCAPEAKETRLKPLQHVRLCGAHQVDVAPIFSLLNTIPTGTGLPGPALLANTARDPNLM